MGFEHAVVFHMHLKRRGT